MSGDSFILKSIKGLGIPTKNNANIIDIANEIIHKKKANNEKITEFLQKLVISAKKRDLLEKRTPGQAYNSAWKKGRITASLCHDVYTKINNIVKKTKPIALVAKLINRDKDLSKLPAIT